MSALNNSAVFSTHFARQIEGISRRFLQFHNEVSSLLARRRFSKIEENEPSLSCLAEVSEICRKNSCYVKT